MSALLGLYLRLIIVVGAIGLAALAIKALYEHLLFPALSLLGLLLVMTSAATALISVACLLHPPIAGLVTSKIKVSTRFLRHGSRLWIGVLLSSGLVAAGGHLLSDAATSFQQSMEIARNQWEKTQQQAKIDATQTKEAAKAEAVQKQADEDLKLDEAAASMRGVDLVKYREGKAVAETAYKSCHTFAKMAAKWGADADWTPKYVSTPETKCIGTPE